MLLYNVDIVSVVKITQTKIKKEIKEKYAIFFELAKAFYQVIKSKMSEIVKNLYIEHIVNIIMEYK